jgi:hypothetical protein
MFLKNLIIDKCRVGRNEMETHRSVEKWGRLQRMETHRSVEKWGRLQRSSYPPYIFICCAAIIFEIIALVFFKKPKISLISSFVAS